MLRFAEKLGQWSAAVTPGWLFLVTGVVILAAALLLPVQLDLDHLQSRLILMREQAERMHRQQETYQQFHLALRTDDPIVLRRLAYHYLHLKPMGAIPMVSPEPLPEISTVEAMLHQSLPNPKLVAPMRRPSRLVRLTMGNHRMTLMLAGLLFVCAGLTMSPRRTVAASDSTEEKNSILS